MLFAIGCAALAVGLLVPPGPRRVPRVVARARPATPAGLLQRGRLGWAALAGGGAALVVGGVPGLLVGALVAGGVLAVVRHAEPVEVRRRRAGRRRDLPCFVELFGTALRAGAAPGGALAVAASALPGPLADELAPVLARLELGTPPDAVWAELAADPDLGALGRTMARSAASGASVVDAVERLADDLAVQARAGREDRARTVGVRAALPLGLCLLPAFLLTGIVPLVAGAVSGLGW